MRQNKGASPDILRQLLDYDPETGVLTWRHRGLEWFTAGPGRSLANVAACWNSKFAGKPALATDNGQGYASGKCLGKTLKAHRVIWAIVHGAWPDGEIDHINGDPMDNRLCNLRCVSHGENMRNQKRRADNSSGVAGVYLVPGYSRWRAQIKLHGKRFHLGYFATFEEAASAKAEAEERAGYHENHGRAA